MITNGNNRQARLSAFIVVAIFSFTFVPKADAWGDAIPAAIMKQSMEKIYDTIQGTMLGSLKTAAMTLLNTQTMSLIGGVSGTSPIISDLKRFIYAESDAKLLVYRENLFNSIFEGKNTSMYSSGSGTPYYTILADNVRGSGLSEGLRADAADRLGQDPSVAFNSNALGALKALTTKQTNNVFGAQLTMEGMLAAENARLIRIQEIKGATGYAPVEQNGLTVLPGRTVSDIVANTQGSVSQMLAGTTKPEEILGVIAASATNAFMKNMMGNVTREIQGKITAVDRQITRQVNEITSPVTQFSNQVRQQTGVNINPLINPRLAVPKTCLTPGC
jgi:hypothetical protein